MPINKLIEFTVMSFRHLQTALIAQVEYLKRCGVQTNSIAVLGAGECNDVPVGQLRGIFDNIVLADRLAYAPRLNDGQIQCVTCEMTGLNPPETYEATSSKEYFNQLCAKIRLDYVPNILRKYAPYSVVFSDLLTTQLHLPYTDYANETFSEMDNLALAQFLDKMFEQHRQ